MTRWRWLTVMLFAAFLSCRSTREKTPDLTNAYPWVIVEFDSLNRTPTERIAMLKELGFTKYAYDWNIENLDSMAREFELAKENKIAVVAVWFWLNAKRDSIGKIHESNKRMLNIVREADLQTTFWVSFNNNFFEGKSQEESVVEAASMLKMINNAAEAIDCNVALYNHRGWFGDINNQLAVMAALPEEDLGIVYNFHHAHQYLEEYPQLIEKIIPYLISVNLNGMDEGGPEILPLGMGSYEAQMIKELKERGYDGPWGLLGHVREQDVKLVLQENIKGYKQLILNELE